MGTALASPSDVDYRAWPLQDKLKLVRRMREQLHGSWRERARPSQLPPDGEWLTLFLRGGRGSGKTWAGAHILRELIETDPFRESEGPGTWAVVAPTFGDARDKCIESQESGLLLAYATSVGEVEAGISPTVEKWNRSIGELHLRDGSIIRIDGADDGAYRIQGENLRGAWCDEVGLWKQWKIAWEESLGFALRKGESKRIATGTPKRNLPARKLVKQLIEDPRVVSRRLLTRENWDNLAPTFREEVAKYVGTELGRQELEGEMLEEAEGALWLMDWIEELRVSHEPEKGYRAKAIGLDPSDGTEDGAEQAWTVMGLGLDHDLYVIGSDAFRTRPRIWLRKAITEARRQDAVIVVEKNHGGEFLVDLLEQVMKEMKVRVPYRMVTASKGKQTRAEPFAMLYEQTPGKVHHVGTHPELEDQMIGWTGDPGEDSPDRLDSAVWAAYHLMGYELGPSAKDSDKAVPYRDGAKGAEVAVPYSNGEGAVPWQT